MGMNKRDALLLAAPLVFGEQWQSQLSRALGPVHPEGPRLAVDGRLVRRWAAGHRDVPTWVLAAMARMLRARCDEASNMATTLEQVITEAKNA